MTPKSSSVQFNLETIIEALSTLALNPWAVVLLYAPLAAATWALQLGVADSTGAKRFHAFEALQFITLSLGIILYLAAREEGGEAVLSVHDDLWTLGLVVIVIAVGAEFASAKQSVNPRKLSALQLGAAWLNLTLVAGFAEEIWFRGLWMGATIDEPWLAIGAGTVGFGLLHWPRGFRVVITTMALGLLYSSARWEGAPIWSLAVAHGTINWISGTLSPSRRWRFGAAPSLVLMWVIISGGAMLILLV